MISVYSVTYIYVFLAVSCTIGLDCDGNPGTTCVADYCQPEPCTVTGQCVFGQKCSQNVNSRTCVCTSVRYVYHVLSIDYFCFHNVAARICVCMFVYYQ